MRSHLSLHLHTVTIKMVYISESPWGKNVPCYRSKPVCLCREHGQSHTPTEHTHFSLISQHDNEFLCSVYTGTYHQRREHRSTSWHHGTTPDSSKKSCRRSRQDMLCGLFINHDFSKTILRLFQTEAKIWLQTKPLENIKTKLNTEGVKKCPLWDRPRC